MTGSIAGCEVSRTMARFRIASLPAASKVDGVLRSAVEQIVASAPPAESGERVAQAAKWSVTEGTPASTGEPSFASRLKAELQRGRSAYLAAGAALALVVLIAV